MFTIRKPQSLESNTLLTLLLRRLHHRRLLNLIQLKLLREQFAGEGLASLDLSIFYFMLVVSIALHRLL